MSDYAGGRNINGIGAEQSNSFKLVFHKGQEKIAKETEKTYNKGDFSSFIVKDKKTGDMILYVSEHWNPKYSTPEEKTENIAIFKEIQSCGGFFHYLDKKIKERDTLIEKNIEK